MSTLSRYVVREVLSHLGGVLAIILGIFLVQRFASLLADATEGSLPLDAIFRLLGLRTIMALPSLVPVTFYLAVLLGLGRLHQDREMTALAGCGVPPSRIHRAVIALAALATVVNGVLSFSVRPWAATRFQRVRHAEMAKSKIEDMRPRRFYTVERGEQAVIFAGARSESNSRVLQNVFVQMRDRKRVSVFTAKSLVEEGDERGGGRVLRLFDGNRYDIDLYGDERQITTYQELSLRAPPGDDTAPAEREETRSAAVLARSSNPKDAAELQWRIANAVSVLLLAILAIPLSRTGPRQGKYAKLLLAILLYVAYRNLLDAARHWIEDGSLPFFPGLWIVHALCLIVALVLFAVAREGRTGWPRGGRRAKVAA